MPCRWVRRGNNPLSAGFCNQDCRLLRAVRCSRRLQWYPRCRSFHPHWSCSERRQRGRIPAPARRRPYQQGHCRPGKPMLFEPGLGDSGRTGLPSEGPESSRSCSMFCGCKTDQSRPLMDQEPLPCLTHQCSSIRGWRIRQRQDLR